jgi:hypothetical protein
MNGRPSRSAFAALRGIDLFLSHHDAIRRRPSIQRMAPVHRYTQFGNSDVMADLDFLDDVGQYRPSRLAQLSLSLRVSPKGFAIRAHTFLSQERTPTR